MKARIHATFALALVLPAATLCIASAAFAQRSAAGAGPPGPCDIYDAAGTPCVTAHSTTRALYTAYRGPLYQVLRQSDGRTLDIGVVPTGGQANAAAQDSFCAQALCLISRIYDQSGKGNHLYQAPPGTFVGPAKGGFNTLPIADMAPISIGGHKAYGAFFMPGMGLRNNDATGLAINDEPEGMYYVIDGTHYDSGCCFDYGNSSTNSRAVGTGTMETTYFGTATAWGKGAGPGPWIMADMEAGLFSGYNAKENVGSPTIDSWRFVTAMVGGGGGNKWDLRGGNAQGGNLATFYSGVRPGTPQSSAYFPMNKKGAVLLGNGGDNGNGSAGTFYEGVMTTGHPTEATANAVQANIVAARYDVQRLGLTRIAAFTAGATQEVTATFANTTGTAATRVKLSLSLPSGWKAVVAGSSNSAMTFPDSIPPGATVSATFKVTAPSRMSAGFLSARAEWTNSAIRGMQSDTVQARVRNVPPVKINEILLASPTGQFIELYNAGADEVDLSSWSLINTQSQWAPLKLATIPAGTKLAPGAHYLLGMAGSGLVAPARAGDKVINVRSTTDFAAGQQIDVDGETRTIASVGTAAAPVSTLFIPVSTGPWLKFPAGSTNLPVTNASGFVVGERIGIDVGGNYEVATVTAVGKAATQTTLAAAATAGATSLKLASVANLSVGDTLTVDTGSRKEFARVSNVGSGSVDLVAPLKLDHMNGIDVSATGIGIRFSPATKFPHTSGDAVQALGSGLTLDRALSRGHREGVPAVNTQIATVGYQGPRAPNQWFGGALSARAGSLALMDATGTVVIDAVVYGSQQSSSSANGTIASPELATLEGNQRQGGNIVVVPTAPRGGRGRGGAAPAPAAPTPVTSAARVRDGADTDSFSSDFQLQTPTPGAANQRSP
jgi:hypothetical protein